MPNTDPNPLCDYAGTCDKPAVAYVAQTTADAGLTEGTVQGHLGLHGRPMCPRHLAGIGELLEAIDDPNVMYVLGPLSTPRHPFARVIRAALAGRP